MARSERLTVLTLRVTPDLDRRIEREARRRRRTKSALLRETLQRAFKQGQPHQGAEARRQSLLVSGRASEADAIAFDEGAADDRGWR